MKQTLRHCKFELNLIFYLTILWSSTLLKNQKTTLYSLLEGFPLLLLVNDTLHIVI
jgi:hypothetical protein